MCFTPGPGYELAQAAVTKRHRWGLPQQTSTVSVLEAGPPDPGGSMLVLLGPLSWARRQPPHSLTRPSLCVCLCPGLLLTKIPVLCVLGPWLNELIHLRTSLETPPPNTVTL